ncbi:MAG TPA: prolipoprotein diacylglyceryl transferase family protein, partial [Flavisolibacter sp.]|nr:prolipoprotein diacylglyceryl transferase family protein [Flavisolibacter sp.]
YKVDVNNEIALAIPTDFKDSIQAHANFFSQHYSTLDSIPHKSFAKPSSLSFLPNWLFAYHYPNNVNKMGVPIAGCTDLYCSRLAIPVFPTPFYETLLGAVLFLILWAVRKRFTVIGSVFCLYLILNGLERFLIEKIRVNNLMNFFGFRPTQAEVIAVGLMVTGVAGWIFLWQKNQASLRKV